MGVYQENTMATLIDLRAIEHVCKRKDVSQIFLPDLCSPNDLKVLQREVVSC